MHNAWLILAVQAQPTMPYQYHDERIDCMACERRSRI